MAEELKNTIAQNLECPICLNTFKDPKILSCSHTFCKACLDNLLECHEKEEKLQCPICRADTQVPNQGISQLQTNLALKSLIEDVENQHQVCTNCKSDDKPQAVVYCQDCGKYLCLPCQKMHSQWDAFSDHEVIAMSEVASGKVSVRRFRKCRKHPREDEECFCTDCRRFACFKCGVMEHGNQGHQVIDISVYESNHLKIVKDLKSQTDKKRSCIQKYVDVIGEQKDLVSNVKKQCIEDISEAYEAFVRQLTERKEFLIDEVNSQTKGVDVELGKMKEEVQQQITRMDNVIDLVASGTKIPLDMDALAAHDTLCQELQDTLKIDDPDFEQPRKSSKKGKCIAFVRNEGVDELGLGKIQKFGAKTIPLPTEDSMNAMVRTPDGRMAVGCCSGGIQIFSADGQLQETALKDIEIREVGFLSDGRCAVRDYGNDISLHTIDWEKMDVRFETINEHDAEEGDSDGLCVGSDDQIYVGYRDAHKIQVFSHAGGTAVREILCDGYNPVQLTLCDDHLIVNCGSVLSMVDRCGNIKHNVERSNLDPYATVTHDNRILIAWVNHDEGVVSIDEYNKELQHVKIIISDYKIEKSEERKWYYLQEFRSGEIAFCTPDILYIFYLDI